MLFNINSQSFQSSDILPEATGWVLVVLVVSVLSLVTELFSFVSFSATTWELVLATVAGFSSLLDFIIKNITVPKISISTITTARIIITTVDTLMDFLALFSAIKSPPLIIFL